MAANARERVEHFSPANTAPDYVDLMHFIRDTAECVSRLEITTQSIVFRLYLL